MPSVDELIQRARANEIIARNLFEIEVEIMNIKTCSSFFERLVAMVQEKFSIEHVWLALADTSANEHLFESIAALSKNDHQPQVEVVCQAVPMIDFLQLTQSSREPVLVNLDIRRLRSVVPMHLKGLIASAAILPIIFESKVVGALMLGSSDVERYSPTKDHFFLRQLSVKASLSLAGVWARERVNFFATRDPLTLLRNRRELEESLEQELSRHARQRDDMAVMFIDCDDFKQVNDTHGHDVGDKYLKHVATQLIELTRKSDMVFRFAGDEFVVLLPNQAQEGADIIAERIRTHLSETPLVHNDIIVPVKISYGVMSTEGLASVDGPSMMKRADELLYKMKALKPSRRSLPVEQGSSKRA